MPELLLNNKEKKKEKKERRTKNRPSLPAMLLSLTAFAALPRFREAQEGAFRRGASLGKTEHYTLTLNMPGYQFETFYVNT